MKFKKKQYLLIIFVLAAIPLSALADTVEPSYLIKIPEFEGIKPGIGNYITILYQFSIGIAAMLAVIKIIISGVKYMMTGLIDSKSEAVKDIRGALLGLIIIISAVMVLQYINPQLTSLSLLPPEDFGPGTKVVDMACREIEVGALYDYSLGLYGDDECTQEAKAHGESCKDELLEKCDLLEDNASRESCKFEFTNKYKLLDLPPKCQEKRENVLSACLEEVKTIITEDGAKHFICLEAELKCQQLGGTPAFADEMIKCTIE